MSISGRLITAAGEPVMGAEAIGLAGNGSISKVATAEFKAALPGSSNSRLVVLRQRVKRLGGWFELTANTDKAVAVTMQPLGSVRGRVLNPQGKPVADIRVAVVRAGAAAAGQKPSYFVQAMTNELGVFEIDELLTELPSELVILRKSNVAPTPEKQLTLKPSESLDLGDILLTAEK